MLFFIADAGSSYSRSTKYGLSKSEEGVRVKISNKTLPHVRQWNFNDKGWLLLLLRNLKQVACPQQPHRFPIPFSVFITIPN